MRVCSVGRGTQIRQKFLIVNVSFAVLALVGIFDETAATLRGNGHT
jgi:hypothetical protein